MTHGGDVEEADWAADMLYGSEPCAAPQTTAWVAPPTGDGAEADVPQPPDMHLEATDLDPDAHGGDAAPTDGDAIDRSTKIAAVLIGAVLFATALIVAVLLGSRDEAPPAPEPLPSVGATEPTSAAAPVAAPEQDQAVAYTATADCPPGSTSAQALTDTSTDSAWVCVRGPVDARVDGQVLRIDFGRTVALSAVSVTPGWVAKTSGGQGEWLQHRVVSRLQYVFNDDDRTVFTQDTGNTHGPVTAALPRPILASTVTITVLGTSRPPATPSLEPSAPPAVPGFGESVLGEVGAPPSQNNSSVEIPGPFDDTTSDPVDATFAMSALTFLGHPPK